MTDRPAPRLRRNSLIFGGAGAASALALGAGFLWSPFAQADTPGGVFGLDKGAEKFLREHARLLCGRAHRAARRAPPHRGRVDYREPEGLAVQLTSLPRLHMGFASGEGRAQVLALLQAAVDAKPD